MQEGEPLWLPDDLVGLLALQEDEDARCGGCGHLLDESMDPARMDDWNGEVSTCHACAAVTRRRRALSEGEAPYRSGTDGKRVHAVLEVRNGG